MTADQPDSTCCVCLELAELRGGKPLYSSGCCGCWLHLECAYSIARSSTCSKACPLCRAQITLPHAPPVGGKRQFDGDAEDPVLPARARSRSAALYASRSEWRPMYGLQDTASYGPDRRIMHDLGALEDTIEDRHFELFRHRNFARMVDPERLRTVTRTNYFDPPERAQHSGVGRERADAAGRTRAIWELRAAEREAARMQDNDHSTRSSTMVGRTDTGRRTVVDPTDGFLLPVAHLPAGDVPLGGYDTSPTGEVEVREPPADVTADPGRAGSEAGERAWALAPRVLIRHPRSGPIALPAPPRRTREPLRALPVFEGIIAHPFSSASFVQQEMDLLSGLEHAETTFDVNFFEDDSDWELMSPPVPSTTALASTATADVQDSSAPHSGPSSSSHGGGAQL